MKTTRRGFWIWLLGLFGITQATQPKLPSASLASVGTLARKTDDGWVTIGEIRCINGVVIDHPEADLKKLLSVLTDTGRCDFTLSWGGRRYL